MISDLIISAVISLLPVAELRGGMPYAVAKGVSPFLAFVICVIANMLVIPIMYFFLDYVHGTFMKIGVYRRFFTKYVESKRAKLEKYVGTSAEFAALVLFVGVPLPATGAYTGALLAWFFKLDKKKAYLAISLGVLMAGIIVLLVMLGVLSGWEVFVKKV
jgi:uncharacterized membrane protein